jgi:hypothetical protein
MLKNIFISAAFILPFIAVANVQNINTESQKTLPIEDQKLASNQEEEENPLTVFIEDQSYCVSFLGEETDDLADLLNDDDEDKPLIASFIDLENTDVQC